jgi:hypothetical protein
MLINTYILYILYIYVSVYCYMFYNKLLKTCPQLLSDEYKIKHKEFFKLWTQRTGEHSNVKNEYFQISDMYVEIFFVFN